MTVEHFDGAMLKSAACFLSNPWLTDALFCNDAMVAIATMQVILDLYIPHPAIDVIIGKASR